MATINGSIFAKVSRISPVSPSTSPINDNRVSPHKAINSNKLPHTTASSIPLIHHTEANLLGVDDHFNSKSMNASVHNAESAGTFSLLDTSEFDAQRTNNDLLDMSTTGNNIDVVTSKANNSVHLFDT